VALLFDAEIIRIKGYKEFEFQLHCTCYAFAMVQFKEPLLQVLLPTVVSVALSFCSFYVFRRLQRYRCTVLPRFSASTRVEELGRALRQNGVVVLERLVPPEKMDMLLKELETASGVFHGAVGSFAGHHTLRNAAKPLGESKMAQELAVHPLVVATVEEILRPWCKRINLGTCSMISVEAPPSLDEKPAPAQVLHRDNSMWGASTWPWLPTSTGRPEFSVSVMWAASDFTETNGATRFLPGSNHWPLMKHEAYDKQSNFPQGITEEDIVQATMPKGSVVLWCGNTLHGAGAHAPRQLSDDPSNGSTRHGLLFIYNLGWLKSEHNFHWAMPASVMETFSPKLSELVGRVGENAVEHDWFTGPIYTQPYLGGPDGSKAGEGVQF